MTDGNTNVSGGHSNCNSNQLVFTEITQRWDALGSGYRLREERPQNWADKHLAGLEVPVGVLGALILLGVWRWMGCFMWKRGYWWWVLVLCVCGSGEVFGGNVKVRYVNTSGVAVSAGVVEIRISGLYGGNPIGNNGALAAGAVAAPANLDTARNGDNYQRRSFIDGVWSGWASCHTASGTDDQTFTVNITLLDNGPTNASPGVAVTNDFRLKARLTNATGTNNTYQAKVDGANVGSPVVVPPGGSVDFDYTGRPGNFTIGTTGGRSVVDIPAGSSAWAQVTGDGATVPIRQDYTDTGGTGTPPAPPIVWNPTNTNTVTAGVVQQVGELAHQDSLVVQRILNQIAVALTNGSGTNGGGEAIDYRPYWNTNQQQWNSNFVNQANQTAWTNNNPSNVVSQMSGLITSLTGAVSVVVGPVMAFATNTFGTAGTNYTGWTNDLGTMGTRLGSGLSADVGDALKLEMNFGWGPIIWDLDPQSVEQISDVLPWVHLALKMFLTGVFLWHCWRVFDEKVRGVFMVKQTQGLKQQLFGTDASLPAGVVYLVAFILLVVGLASSWLLVRGVLSPLFADLVTGAPNAAVVGIKLLKTLFPWDWAVTLFVAYWVFNVGIFATFTIAALIIRAQVALIVWGFFVLVSSSAASDLRVDNWAGEGVLVQEDRRYQLPLGESRLRTVGVEAGLVVEVAGLGSNALTLANTTESGLRMYRSVVFGTNTVLSVSEIGLRYEWYEFKGCWPWFYGGLAAGCGMVAYGVGQRMLRAAIFERDCDV
jgi:hypothetical protein